MRIPDPFLRPQSINFTINELMSVDHVYKYDDCQTFKGEYLFRFKIPPFQRPVVWSDEQCIKFLESAWLGFDIGSYVVNKVDWVGDKIHEADDYLIDGRQRITAIKKYSEDEFKVFGLFWSELSERENRRFRNIQFTQNRVFFKDDQQLRDLYNRLNYGGTTHTEDQRA